MELGIALTFGTTYGRIEAVMGGARGFVTHNEISEFLTIPRELWYAL
jgi:hypothetical protein